MKTTSMRYQYFFALFIFSSMLNGMEPNPLADLEHPDRTVINRCKHMDIDKLISLLLASKQPSVMRSLIRLMILKKTASGVKTKINTVFKLPVAPTDSGWAYTKHRWIGWYQLSPEAYKKLERMLSLYELVDAEKQYVEKSAGHELDRKFYGDPSPNPAVWLWECTNLYGISTHPHPDTVEELRIDRNDRDSVRIQGTISGEDLKPFQNLEKCVVRSAQVSFDADAFTHTPHLKKLILFNSSQTEVPQSMSELKELEFLEIESCPMNAVHLHAFQFQNTLTDLRLNDLALKDLPSNILYQLTNLKRFECARNLIRTIDYRDFENNRKLEELDITKNPFIYISETALENLREIKTIKLDNDSFFLFPGSPKILKLLDPHLKTIAIQGNPRALPKGRAQWKLTADDFDTDEHKQQAQRYLDEGIELTDHR